MKNISRLRNRLLIDRESYSINSQRLLIPQQAGNED